MRSAETPSVQDVVIWPVRTDIRMYRCTLHQTIETIRLELNDRSEGEGGGAEALWKKADSVAAEEINQWTT